MNLLNRKRGLVIGFALIATGAFAVGGTVLAASPSSAAETQNVDYYKAELQSPEGARQLYWRIQAAARQVCHGEPDNRELARHRIYEQCYEEAVDTAVARIDETALTALHRSKGQRGSAS